jgi:hypothetical protein
VYRLVVYIYGTLRCFISLLIYPRPSYPVVLSREQIHEVQRFLNSRLLNLNKYSSYITNLNVFGIIGCVWIRT